MKYNLFFLITILFLSNGMYAQQKTKQKEVLLIGTFHFNNPGGDLVKGNKFDVLSKESQAELDLIANQISSFSPDKIFTEWDYDEAIKLDSLYSLYVENKYFDFVKSKYPNSSFYKENEIFQLAFRAAKLSNHKKVYGIDIKTEFPFDRVMASIEKANQEDLRNKIFKRIKEVEDSENVDKQKNTLTKLILDRNEQSNRDLNLGSYITLMNRAGEITDFTGADLVASWYRRNLIMYSFVQKLTEENDTNIVIILGSAHVAIFKHFIDLDENFKVVELKEIMEK